MLGGRFSDRRRSLTALPEEVWGMKLGSRVNDIRSKEIYVKDHPLRFAELDALGFRWNSLAS